MNIPQYKNTKMINILIVDTHEVFRIGLKQILKKSGRSRKTMEAESVVSAMELIRQKVPDLVLLELSQEKLNGTNLLHQVSKLPSEKRPVVLVLSDLDEKIYAERVYRAGANGYVMKTENVESILHAITTVLEGKVYFSPAIFKSISPMKTRHRRALGTIDRLSNREFEVLSMTGSGFRPRVIADELGLSVRTVETYFSRIKQKLDLKNAADLGQFAVKWLHGK